MPPQIGSTEYFFSSPHLIAKETTPIFGKSYTFNMEHKVKIASKPTINDNTDPVFDRQSQNYCCIPHHAGTAGISNGLHA